MLKDIEMMMMMIISMMMMMMMMMGIRMMPVVICLPQRLIHALVLQPPFPCASPLRRRGRRIYIYIYIHVLSLMLASQITQTTKGSEWGGGGVASARLK